MFKYRKLLILAILLLATTAIGFILYHRAVQTPEAAALLPEGDLLVYANLKPIHLFDMGNPNSIKMEGEYQDFISQTGIQFERDLDEVAMSRHDTADGRDVESSEIFIGHYDLDRLKNYFQKLASSSEAYRNFTIYSIQHEGHIVRVALLPGKIAVTNMVSPEPMHGIIDRTYKSSSGPALLKEHYNDVPLGSVSWLIYRIPSKPDNIQLPGGFALTIPGDTTAVASLRYTGSLLLRADIFAQSEAQAKQITDDANSHLALVRSISHIVGTRSLDKDLRDTFESIQVAQKENVAVFTATVPQTILKKIWSEAQSEPATPAPAASPTPAATPAPRHRHRR